jgi:hypothetical protein
MEVSARKGPAEDLGCSGGVVDEEEAKELGCCVGQARHRRMSRGGRSDRANPAGGFRQRAA